MSASGWKWTLDKESHFNQIVINEIQPKDTGEELSLRQRQNERSGTLSGAERFLERSRVAEPLPLWKV